MKLPTVRASEGFSTYLSEDNGNWGWQVANSAGSPVAGCLRLVVISSFSCGWSGTPGQEGERDEVPGWNFLTGRFNGTQYGWHVYWQFWDPGGDAFSYWYAVKVDDRPAEYISMVLITIQGADPANPIEINNDDPNDAFLTLGYQDREWVNVDPDIAGPPVQEIAGLIAPTSPELMILCTYTSHEFGANNMWSYIIPEDSVTTIRRVSPTFPNGSYEEYMIPPGSPMGSGDVLYAYRAATNHVGLGPSFTRECWRYADDPDYAELAYQESVTYPEDPNPPIIQNLAGSIRLAIRGKPSGLVAMI